jgi:hypothetical protein
MKQRVTAKSLFGKVGVVCYIRISFLLGQHRSPTGGSVGVCLTLEPAGPPEELHVRFLEWEAQG